MGKIKPKYRHAACVWTVNDGSSRFSGPSRPSLSSADTAKKVKLIGEGKTGVKGIEFHYPNEINEKNAKQVNKVMKDYGFVTAMVTPNNHHFSINRGLSSAHKSERKQGIERAKRTIDMAYELGTKVVVFWQGGEKYDDYTSINFCDAINWYVDSVNKIIRYDVEEKEDRITLAAEAKPNEPGRHMLFQTDSDYLGLRHLLEHPEKFKLNPETGHSEMIGLDPVQTLAHILMQDALGHYHLNKQWGLKFDTDDQVDFDKPRLFLVKLLMEAGFDGFVGHDIQPRHNYNAKDNIRVIKESVANAKALEQLVSEINWKQIEKMEKEGAYLDAKMTLDKYMQRGPKRRK